MDNESVTGRQAVLEERERGMQQERKPKGEEGEEEGGAGVLRTESPTSGGPVKSLASSSPFSVTTHTHTHICNTHNSSSTQLSTEAHVNTSN